VLIDGGPALDAFERLATELIAAGVHVLQLRDKHLGDRDLLARAQRLRELTHGTGTLFIMNDRPDLAVLAEADGVHLGQEEVSVKDARRIVGPEMLMGVSTHSIEQARQTVLNGADYLGLGPMFPSGTKRFEQFPGLDFLRRASGEITLPAFAIGGITPENLAQILATGIRRVAVGQAIVAADNPAEITREMLLALARQPA
jgi:thiamine-phosphate pyrophosphorylase